MSNQVPQAILTALELSQETNKNLNIELAALKEKHERMESCHEKVREHLMDVMKMSAESVMMTKRIYTELANGLFTQCVKELPFKSEIQGASVFITLGNVNGKVFGLKVSDDSTEVSSSQSTEKTANTTDTTSTSQKTEPQKVTLYKLFIMFDDEKVFVPEQGYVQTGKVATDFDNIITAAKTLAEVLPGYFTAEKIEELSKKNSSGFGFLSEMLSSLGNVLGAEFETEEVEMNGFKGFKLSRSAATSNGSYKFSNA